MKKNLSLRVMIYTVSSLLINGISFISAPIFVRLMSASDYGIVSVFSTWVLIITAIVGLRVEGSIQMAKTEYGEANLGKYCSSILTLALFSFFLFGALLVPLFAIGIDKYLVLLGLNRELCILVLLSALGLTCLNVRKSYFVVKREAFKDMLVSVLVSLSGVGLSIIFIMLQEREKYLGRAIGLTASYFFIGGFFFLYMAYKGHSFINIQYWKFCLSLSLPLILSGISSMIINQSDRLMINAINGSEAAGIYSFCYNISLVLSTIYAALNTAWVPEYYTFKETNDDKAIHDHAQIYRYNFTLLTIGFLLISPEVVKLIGTKSYYQGIAILPLIALSYYFQFLYSWGINFEFYNKKTKHVGVSFSLAAVINICLNYFFIPKYGMTGAAIASCFSFAILFLIHHYIVTKKMNGFSLTMKWYLAGLIPVLIVFVLSYVLMNFGIVRWCLGVVAGMLLIKNIVKNKKII